MIKKLYKKLPGRWVFCYSNSVIDLFDEKRWKPKARVKTIHNTLRPYIKRYYSPEGKLLRTKGAAESNRIAKLIIKRLFQLVKEDMIENNDFFYLPNEDYIGHKTVPVFNPDTLNRRVYTYLIQGPISNKKCGNNYKFVFDNEGLKRLTAKIRINVNSNCLSKNHRIYVGDSPQECGNKRLGYRRMVWGMH